MPTMSDNDNDSMVGHPPTERDTDYMDSELSPSQPETAQSRWAALGSEICPWKPCPTLGQRWPGKSGSILNEIAREVWLCTPAIDMSHFVVADDLIFSLI